MGDNVNEVVPEKPAFNLTEFDKWILKQDDETFTMHDWEELRQTIGTLSSLGPFP